MAIGQTRTRDRVGLGGWRRERRWGRRRQCRPPICTTVETFRLYRLSLVPLDIFPLNRCLGIFVCITRSASPIFACLFILFCIFFIFLRAASCMAVSLRPTALGSGVWLAPRARDAERARDAARSFFDGSSASMASYAAAAAEELRSRLRPRVSSRALERERTRSTALLGSMPISASASAIVSAVLPGARAACAVRGIGWRCCPATFSRRECCFTTAFFLRILPSSCASPASSRFARSSSSSSIAAAAAASAASSSRSSSSRRASMSGSTKSATLWPSTISGMLSCFHSESSRRYFLRQSIEYAPAPPFSSCRSFSVRRLARSASACAAGRACSASTLAGICAGRAPAPAARGLGWATCTRLRKPSILLPRILASTRAASRRSHARCLTSMTPCSLTVLIVMGGSPAATASGSATARISLMSSTCSGSRSSHARASVLLHTTSSGLFRKSGLMEWKRLACCSSVYPHCSEMSTT
mmetsp:Transcript_6784/g.27733  ORF Transcript_6784/g.27733 Transcript_6784/m.27733 type:complete len:474 (+) Transcript_6784:94-1515(+)